MLGLSAGHIMLMLVVVILVFGTSKLKDIGKDIGGAVRGFKDAMNTSEESKPKAALQKIDQHPHHPSAMQQQRTDNA